MAFAITALAAWSYLVVGIIAAVMAGLTWRSYRHTGNIKLLFVFMAFFTILVKSLLVLLHEWAHLVENHHEVLVIMGLFDVLIVLLFFVPFLAAPRREG